MLNTYSIFDPDCVEEIKNAKTIDIFAENEYNESVLANNIIFLLEKIIGMDIIILSWLISDISYQSTKHSLDQLRECHNSKNTVVLVENFVLTDNEKDELRASFGKIIYTYPKTDYSAILDTTSDIKFLYVSKKINMGATISFGAHTIDEHHVSLIKKDLIKIYKIETPYTYYCSQSSRDTILQAINNISDDKSVFYSKSSALFDSLWRKYRFLTKCIKVWLEITHFVDCSNDILNIIINLMIEMYDAENHVYTWQPPSLLNRAVRMNTYYLMAGTALLRYSN